MNGKMVSYHEMWFNHNLKKKKTNSDVPMRSPLGNMFNKKGGSAFPIQFFTF